jgi:hypothetical protein
MAEETKRTFTVLGERLADVMKKVMAGAPHPEVRQPAVIDEPEEVRSYWFVAILILGVVLVVLFIWRPPWFKSLLSWRPHFGTPAATQPDVTSSDRDHDVKLLQAVARLSSQKPLVIKTEKHHDGHRAPTTAPLPPEIKAMMDYDLKLEKEGETPREFDQTIVARPPHHNPQKPLHFFPLHAYDKESNRDITVAIGGEMWYTKKELRRRIDYQGKVTITENDDGQVRYKKIAVFASSPGSPLFAINSGKVEAELRSTENELSSRTWEPFATLNVVTIYGDPQGDIEYELGYDEAVMEGGRQVGVVSHLFGNVVSIMVSELSLEEVKKIPEVRRFMRAPKVLVRTP